MQKRNYKAPIKIVDEHTETITFETYRTKISSYHKDIVAIINLCKNLKQIVFNKDIETGLLKDDPPRFGWRDEL